jgi:alpha-methylacyl-CoA racemase
VVLCDLKEAVGREAVLKLLDCADVLVEGFRPGVMERLGLGPDTATERNPRLVYARMTGWGQDGPLAQAAGHDLNYISLAGALHAIGPADSAPVPPLNLVGDYGGGSLYLVAGILAALHERQASGRGQVVDASITDGTLSLMTYFAQASLRGTHGERRGSNLLDGGSPYYGVYETQDGLYVSVAPIEPQFFAELCERLGVDPRLRDAQQDSTRWPALRTELARILRSKPRAHWVQLLEGTDACFAPVLPLSEARSHPHNVARQSFVEIAGVPQPAPAPRFSRTPSKVQGPAPTVATPISQILAGWA